MSRTSRTIGAVALLALIGAAGAWVVLSEDDSDQTAASSPPAQGAPKPSQQKPAHGKPRLELSDRGQPIVWLRHGARIPIHSAPGGKVVDTLRWRTPFHSRTVLSVFRQVGQWAGAPTPLLPTGKLGWVKLDPSKLRAGWTPYAIDVDLSSRAAQLRRGDRVLRSFAVTVGAPGTSTPTGKLRGHRHLPRQPQPGLRVLRGRHHRAPAAPALRLVRRRPDRDPRHHRRARR